MKKSPMKRLEFQRLMPQEPSEETKALMGEYIDGKMELEDVLNATIKRYAV